MANLGDLRSSLPISPERELKQLRARNAQLEKKLEGLLDDKASEATFHQMLINAVDALLPTEPYRWQSPKQSEMGSPIESSFMASDWHIGSVSSKAETEGFGEFNWETAISRVFYMTKKAIDHIYTQRNGFIIRTLNVLALGDFVSGDIHEELRRKNEFDLPVQTANAGWLLAEMVRMFAPHFDEIKIKAVRADNHGRLTLKPQAKGKSTNNMNHLVYKLAQALLREHQHVTWEVAEASTLITPINGVNFLLEHGDNYKSWMGIPYYGIERGQGREARRRLNMPANSHHFKYQAIGHFHAPGLIPSVLPIMINGSLSGTNEYDHQSGRHAHPAQVHFLTHPKHGIFNWTAFRGE